MREVYISVDVEAAGPYPPTYSMLSLGAVVVDRSQDTHNVELRPLNSNAIPAAIEVVGRPLDDFARVGRDPKDTMADFRAWLATVAGGGRPCSWASTLPPIGPSLITTSINIWGRTRSASAVSTSRPIIWASAGAPGRTRGPAASPRRSRKGVAPYPQRAGRRDGTGGDVSADA